MAHLEKYQRGAVAHMLSHYTRSHKGVLARENIDETRTHLNYTISYHEGRLIKSKKQVTSETVARRIESVQEATNRKVRKDAVVMADLVVTAPKNVPEGGLENFFAAAYEFMEKKVGKENLLGGFVHMDETTPHEHIPFTPIKDGKFNYKGMCPRNFYQTLHKELGDYLENRLGYRPEIEITEERKAEKVLSSVPQVDLDQARTAILGRLEAEKAEIEKDIRRKQAEYEQQAFANASLAKEADALNNQLVTMNMEYHALNDDLESLQQRRDEAAGRVKELESIVADVRAWENADKAAKLTIFDRIADFCMHARRQIEERSSGLRKRAEILRGRIETAKSTTNEYGKRILQLMNRDLRRSTYTPVNPRQEQVRAIRSAAALNARMPNSVEKGGQTR